MPQRVNNVDTHAMSGFLYMLGTWVASLNLSGPQILGAIIGSAFFITTMSNSKPFIKLLNFFGSLGMGIVGSHFAANVIVGLPFVPSTVTQQSAIGFGAAISATCGIIILKRFHKFANKSTPEDIKSLGGKHD